MIQRRLIVVILLAMVTGCATTPRPSISQPPTATTTVILDVTTPTSAPATATATQSAIKTAVPTVIVITPPVPATTTIPLPLIDGTSTTKLPVLLAIKDVQPLRFEEPLSFWRNGEQIESRDVVLLRVSIGEPLLFLPRDSTAPLFVYGDTVCNVVQDPLAADGAVLLAPALSQGAPSLLWLTLSSVSAHDLTAEGTRVWREWAISEDSGNFLVVPKVEGVPKVYHDRAEFEKEVGVPVIAPR